MRKPLFLRAFLFALALAVGVLPFLTSCTEPAAQPEETPPDALSGITDAVPVGPVELGNPFSNYKAFEDFPMARCIWELYEYEDKIYIGCGDGNNNTAPTPIFAYNPYADAYVPDDIRFSLTGEVMEEWVDRFFVLNGTLGVLGADPAVGVHGWEVGTYYTLETDGWKEHLFHSGTHTYDFIEYEGAQFIAKQTLYDGEPVIRSADGGETWENVAMIKDGVRQIWEEGSYIRGEKFLTLNGKLYLYFYNTGKELGYKHFVYEYKDGAFHQLPYTWPQNLDIRSQMPNAASSRLENAVEFGGKVYLVTGHLMATDDLSTIGRVALPEACRVQDICVTDDTLYVMASTQKELSSFETAVFATTDGETFECAARFSYPIPCYSFLAMGDSFYFGTGSSALTEESAVDHEKLGMLLSYPNLFKTK